MLVAVCRLTYITSPISPRDFVLPLTVPDEIPVGLQPRSHQAHTWMIESVCGHESCLPRRNACSFFFFLKHAHERGFLVTIRTPLKNDIAVVSKPFDWTDKSLP